VACLFGAEPRRWMRRRGSGEGVLGAGGDVAHAPVGQLWAAAPARVVAASGAGGRGRDAGAVRVVAGGAGGRGGGRPGLVDVDGMALGARELASLLVGRGASGACA
jgi:hypothetical protein